METWLDVGAAVFALVAAVFWFLSAVGNVPKLVRLSTSASEPFYSALQFSAEMNRWAALFSSLSALCAGGKLLFLA
jgi:hypothetical protein